MAMIISCRFVITRLCFSLGKLSIYKKIARNMFIYKDAVLTMHVFSNYKVTFPWYKLIFYIYIYLVDFFFKTNLILLAYLHLYSDIKLIHKLNECTNHNYHNGSQIIYQLIIGSNKAHTLQQTSWLWDLLYCGVAIRAASDIYVINRCPGDDLFFGFKHCVDDVLDVKKQDDFNYVVSLNKNISDALNWRWTFYKMIYTRYMSFLIKCCLDWWPETKQYMNFQTFSQFLDLFSDQYVCTVAFVDFSNRGCYWSQYIPIHVWPGNFKRLM